MVSFKLAVIFLKEKLFAHGATEMHRKILNYQITQIREFIESVPNAQKYKLFGECSVHAMRKMDNDEYVPWRVELV